MKLDAAAIQPQTIASLSTIESPRLSAKAGTRPSFLRHVSLIAAKEFSDRFRSGWVIACVLVWLGAIVLTSVLGLLQIGRIGMQGFDRTVITLLNLIQYLVPLLGLLLGHDLIASETEEGTSRLVLAGGTSRTRFIFGKFLGGCITLALPLVLGFIIAGTVIGLTAKDGSIVPFVRLAMSGLILGILFVGMALAISTFCRTRLQSLVLALITWCLAVFVFDLVALGLLISTQAPVAAQEIEIVCDATHVNAAADIHSDLDNVVAGRRPVVTNQAPSLGWLAINPVDLFRAVNLSRQLELNVPFFTMLLSITLWLVATVGVSLWKLHRTDL